jgi:hypothetical protein
METREDLLYQRVKTTTRARPGQGQKKIIIARQWSKQEQQQVYFMIQGALDATTS